MAAYDFADFISPTPHPGEHLREEFLPGYHLTAGALAKAMGLKDRTRIERLIREPQPVTADTALRLARMFGTTPSSGSICKPITIFPRQRSPQRQSLPP